MQNGGLAQGQLERGNASELISVALAGTSFAVEYRTLDRIIPYARNARKIPEAAVDKVAASIREFGWRQPIVVDETGVIIAGHTRLLAARRLEMAEAPVHVARGLTPQQVKALRLMDNRSHQETSWDYELLGLELGELEGIMDLALSGFEPFEIESLVADDKQETQEIPALPATAVTEPGDIWICGAHRVLCGDARDPAAISRLIADRKINIVFTSPPYAEQRDYDKSSGFKLIPPDRYVEWFKPVAHNIQQRMAPDGSYFLNIKPAVDGLDTELYVFDLVIAHVREWGWHFATEFCWERPGVPKIVTRRFKNSFEPIYQFALNHWKMRPDAVRHASENVPLAAGPMFGAAKKRRNGTSQAISDIQGVAKDAGEYIMPGLAYPSNRLPTFAGTHQATGHTAAFPVGLPEFFIRAYTDKGDSTYDPFAGSGSVLIAAEKQQRSSFSMELSAAYCDVIVKRWQNFTQQQARLESNKRTFADRAGEKGI